VSDRRFVSRVIVSALLVAACGSSSTGSPNAVATDAAPASDRDATPEPDAPPANDARPFLGTWKYTDGTRTLTCPTGSGMRTETLTGTVDLAVGVDAPLVLLIDGSSLEFDVMAAHAQLRPGQVGRPRSILLGDGGATAASSLETDTYNAGVIFLTEDMATLSASGTALVMTSSGATLPCTFTLTGMLARIGP
jgi:hypothetical protein